MQRMAKVPLIVAGDFERGASMRVESTTLFPHAMAFTAGRDVEAARFAGQVTARESRALGFQWVLVPVADVNNNPDNPVINIRSYGENPDDVSAYVKAFIEGARSSGVKVLTTAKHFPGHGDTAVDSHANLAAITADRARLEAVELAPFRAAIAAGADAVMTAHIGVPALDQPDVPATLSAAVLTQLLRKEMKFEGLISTDALEMGGVAKGFSVGEAAVRALEAGADVLLMPPSPETAIKAVVAAVRQGRLTEKRIEESVLRVLAAKQRVGLDRTRIVEVEAISDTIDTPEAAERAQQIANRAVTLLKNERGLAPIRAGDGTGFLIMIENRYSIQGQALAEQIDKLAPGSTVVTLDPLMTQTAMQDQTRLLETCPHVAALAFASANVYKSGEVLPEGYSALIRSLAATRPVTLVSLGTPYLVRSFPEVGAYLTTYSPVVTSEMAAVAALFGKIPIGGKLPVTIPGVAKYGEGIEIPLR
jgi:beta-N-acetylhexosaminidase